MFLNVPTLGCIMVFGEFGLLDFPGVDSAGHYKQVDVCSKLAFSWRVLRACVIVGEPKRVSYLERG